MSSQPTLNERVEFGDRFPRLQGLLVEFIDYDSRTDDQILQEYLERTPNDTRRKVIEQGRAFLSQRELPFSLVQSRTNRYFPTDEATRDWLLELLRRIESTLQVPHVA